MNEVFIFLVVLREVCLNQFFSSTQSFMTTSTKQGHPSETKDGGNYRSGWDANHTTNAAIVPACNKTTTKENISVLCLVLSNCASYVILFIFPSLHKVLLEFGTLFMLIFLLILDRIHFNIFLFS